MNIRLVRSDEWLRLEKLAYGIWRDHYTPIIGSEQVEYMLQQFQSVLAMQNQVSEGYRYYVVLKDQQMQGYFAVQKRKSILFLSKIYLLVENRGKGWGKRMLDFIQDLAKESGCTAIELTVNKNNQNSIDFYSRQGFEKCEALIIDIGKGYVMDDYKMRLAIE